MTELLHEIALLREDIEGYQREIERLTKVNSDLRFQLGVYSLAKHDFGEVLIDEQERA